MRKLFILIISIAVAFVSCQNNSQSHEKQAFTENEKVVVDTSDFTNNFYDNEKIHALKTNVLEITGEIHNPGTVNLEVLPLRSIIVKEALPDENGNKFIGAYRYDGYSLYDILNLHTPDKVNQEAFPPIIDLYVTVENAKGEKAVFSWGEIYYPNHLHEILLATKVMRIVPSKTHELWPLPEVAKIVVGHDLLTSRNIESPIKITVKSASCDFEITKGMSPMFAPAVNVFANDKNVLSIEKPVKKIEPVTYETIFYGRGRGIHSTTPFTGQQIKTILVGQIESTEKNIREAFLIFAAKDGYRGVFSYSEIFNRNDQAELLLIYNADDHKGGAFRLFPAGDFFSDRAIKSLDRIYFEDLK